MIETIQQLDVTKPDRLKDLRKDGDDKIRELKHLLLTVFPGFNSAAPASHTELNFLTGITSNVAEQLGTKAPIESPEFTDVPRAPTKPVGSSGNGIATIDFVTATALNGALPGQAGNAGKLLSTDGTNANWTAAILTPNTKPAVGVNFANTNNAQTLRNKTIVAPVMADNLNITKKATFILGGMPVGTTTLKLPNEDVQLCTPYETWLETKTVTGTARWVEFTITQPNFIGFSIYANRVLPVAVAGAFNTNVVCQLKINGKWRAGGAYSGSTPDDVASYSTGQVDIPAQPGETRGFNMFIAADTDEAVSNCHFKASIFAPTDPTLKARVYFDGAKTRVIYGGLDYAVVAAKYRGDILDVAGSVTGIRFSYAPRKSGAVFVTPYPNIAGTFKLFGIRAS